MKSKEDYFNQIYENNILVLILDYSNEKENWLSKYIPFNVHTIDAYIYVIEQYTKIVQLIKINNEYKKLLIEYKKILHNFNLSNALNLNDENQSFQNSYKFDIDVDSRLIGLLKSAQLALQYIKSEEKINISIFREFRTIVPSILISEKENINYGYGRADSFFDAKNIALLEYIERRTSRNLIYNSKHNVIKGNYKNLKAKYNLINPKKLILPQNNKYDDNLNLTWIKCESIINKVDIYVPIQEMVYGHNESFSSHKSNILYSTSNGVSLSSQYYESVYYGILEIIERHNFLYHWYYDVNPKRINWKNLEKFPKKEIVELSEKKENLKIDFFLLNEDISINEYMDYDRI